MVSPIVYHGAGILSSFICVDLGPFPTDPDFITFTLARTNSICEEKAKKEYPVGESMILPSDWEGYLTLSIFRPSKRRAPIARAYQTWLWCGHLAHDVLFMIFKI